VSTSENLRDDLLWKSCADLAIKGHGLTDPSMKRVSVMGLSQSFFTQQWPMTDFEEIESDCTWFLEIVFSLKNTVSKCQLV